MADEWDDEGDNPFLLDVAPTNLNAPVEESLPPPVPEPEDLPPLPPVVRPPPPAAAPAEGGGGGRGAGGRGGGRGGRGGGRGAGRGGRGMFVEEGAADLDSIASVDDSPSFVAPSATTKSPAGESSFDLDAMVGDMAIGGQDGAGSGGAGSAGGAGGASGANSGEPAVDPQQLASLLELGFSENKAKRALFQHLSSVDEALQWLLEKGEDPALDAPLMPKDWTVKPAGAKSAASPSSSRAAPGAAEMAIPEGCQQFLITGSRLGVTLSNDKDSGQLCALEVVDRGPAFDAGMRAGDLIVAVEGEASFGFATAPEATTALRAMLKDKGRATFTVKRPEGVGSEHTWACATCTYHNPVTAPACGMCHQLNPNGPPPSAAGATAGAGGAGGEYLSAESLGFPPGQEGVAAAMGAMGFPQYTAQLTDFGVESPKDLSDLQLLPDQDLIDEVGMSAADVSLFRTALDHLLRHGPPGGARPQRRQQGGGGSSSSSSAGRQPAPAPAPSSSSGKSRNVPGTAVRTFLDLYGLSQYHEAILAFGVESVEDLCDQDILGDNELAYNIKMSREDIRTFREATREALNSGGFEILDELG